MTEDNRLYEALFYYNNLDTSTVTEIAGGYTAGVLKDDPSILAPKPKDPLSPGWHKCERERRRAIALGLAAKLIARRN